MPLFFFNYRERNDYTVDDSGVEFESFECAWLDAFNTAREMWPEVMARRVDPFTCGFDIYDSEGNLLAMLNFKELLENCRVRSTPCQIDRTFANVVDTAHETRRRLAEFHEELDRARGRLDGVRQLVGMIEGGSATRHGH